MIDKTLLEGLRRYVDNRIPTGSFLRAVLENDFMEAVGRADAQNIWWLREIRDYILEFLPLDCYGSPEKVKQWLERNTT